MFVAYALSLFISVILVVVMLIWVKQSSDNYPTDRWVRPGDTYQVKDRNYTAQKHPAYWTDGKLIKDQKMRMLSAEFQDKQRELVIAITKMFDDLKVDYTISGGTLIGFIHRGGLILHDDDVDMLCSWDDRTYLWGSEKFLRECETRGLELIFLPFANLDTGTRESCCVRIRFKNTHMPVCDVFFRKDMDDDPTKVAKIDSWWNDKITFNSKEQFLKTDFFPLKHIMVDDINVTVPNKPNVILEKQYGKSVSKKIVVYDRLFSHAFPFQFLGFMWQVRKPAPLPVTSDP
jgi:hypothetical protein